LHTGLTSMGFTCSIANDSSNFSEELMKQVCDVVIVDIEGSRASAKTELMLEQLRELRMIRNLPTIALICDQELNYLDSNLEIDDFVVKG